ncbi:MAG: hypothetical protein L6R36_008472 [Xanthoria steineri]|nr:MAG: hypothetical protein L6R36_008472 [Xanthoria steineri]
MEEPDSQDATQEDVPTENIFIAPSIHEADILAGVSYTHHSPIPQLINDDLASIECVLGVDEAGRGPVLGEKKKKKLYHPNPSNLFSQKPSIEPCTHAADIVRYFLLGPMVYGLLYLPLTQHTTLLAQTHRFDDSKVLKPQVRSNLMQAICTPGTDLFRTCGWATRVMSARDIAAGMLKPAGVYNLNAQAMDATVQLIKDVFAQGVNVKEIYIDTIGKADVYQKKLERIFPTTMITVAEKADSLYPCVSAASVCAKVTRDAALEVSHQAYSSSDTPADEAKASGAEAWGTGYPSSAKTVNWLKEHMDPLFGWGNECRMSWGTAKDMLEAKGNGIKVEWPDVNDDEQARRMTDFYITTSAMEVDDEPDDELATWYGKPVPASTF